MKSLFMKKKGQIREVDSQGPVNAPEEAGSDADSKNPALTDRMRVSCDISRAHHRKLKVYAAQRGITLNAAIEELADYHCENLLHKC